MVKFLDLKKQYDSIKEEIDEAISKVIETSAFVGGPFVKEFEEHFAAYLNVNHCVGVGNGTDALEIAIETLDLPEESEIIVPANTFIATSEAVTRTGHKVVFCDIDEADYTISPDSIEKHITDKTSAVIAVHLYGNPADMDSITSLGRKYRLKIIEDCAQAHGAKYKGKKVGTFGDIATFSFYPGKNLGAYGDGGAVVTNVPALAEKCRMIANHGRSEKYLHLFEGRNSRLDGLQAAVLSVKLKYLDEWISRRNEIAEYYRENLKDIEQITLPGENKNVYHAYHLFVIRVKNRDSLKSFLQKNGIQTGIHYPISLPKQPAYKHLADRGNNFISGRIDEELLSLPIGEHMTSTDAKDVVSHIKEFFA